MRRQHGGGSIIVRASIQSEFHLFEFKNIYLNENKYLNIIWREDGWLTGKPLLVSILKVSSWRSQGWSTGEPPRRQLAAAIII